MKYIDEAREIWQKCVPKSGQSLTVEGEMLRSIEGLRWETQNNGNLNWDKGFEMYCEFLRKILCDKEIFNDDDIEIISTDINRLQVSGVFSRSIERDSNFDIDKMPYVADDLYDRLSDYVVLWFLRQGRSVPREVDSKQYR